MVVLTGGEKRVAQHGRPATVRLGRPLFGQSGTAATTDCLQPTESVESAPTATGTASRTATTTYDAAGRATTVAITASEGAAVPTVTTTYDAATGLATRTTAGGGAIARTHDRLGRQVSSHPWAAHLDHGRIHLWVEPKMIQGASRDERYV
jgi:hypothetical protein